MAMKLGATGREHEENMKRTVVINGTAITMDEIQAIINKKAGDNIPYANKIAKDAFFANDIAKLTQLLDALKEM